MRRTLIASVAATGLAGCAATSPLDAALSTASSPRLEVWAARAYATPKGVVVAGAVRRPALSRGPISGHVHVEARFADGRPPVVAVALWGSVPARGARLAHFRVALPVADRAPPTAISVSHLPHAHADERPGIPPSGSARHA